MNNIRNFVIIAHIDHGKSTLADRMLELTGTVEKRVMKTQYLDQMDLERERGITIKMTPVRMNYQGYILNLIDTPGHSDFGYEVSRALEAVEGAILLVDGTQGIQAQTLSNFETAKRAGLKIIGVVNKVDVADQKQIDDVTEDLCELLNAHPDDILFCSGKTGVGVDKVLASVIENVPAPTEDVYELKATRALVFDSIYDEHKGVIANVRVFSGEITLNEDYYLVATSAQAKAKHIGYFKPGYSPSEKIKTGEIGFVATGIKDPDSLKIGDTLTNIKPGSVVDEILALPGYREARPVVFVSFYPEDADDYDDFKKALSKLRLSDSALTFEPDTSEVLGRGFKGGFLGRLHFEIITERIFREFDIEVVSSFPSVAYKVKPRSTKDLELEPAENGFFWVKNPKDLPEEFLEILEPMTKIEILTPIEYLGAIMQLTEFFRLFEIVTKPMGVNKVIISAKLPLADLILDFDDKLKSVSAGFGSLSYEIVDYEKADVDSLEIMVAGQVMPGLIRILPRAEMEKEARKTLEKLKNLMPKQQFAQALQAKYKGKIIARENISAMSKNVTGHLYGGDRTRKMKLWKKQKAGKKKLKERGEKNRVRIPSEVFKELMKK
ncbi:MAG: elongation factor 4 [Candidatus Harrisonbacteria bacterium CG10_big_fil_rev_8_21_14_0_10_38_8]|uniref:Elongation factor 4 n=1 Tax=Candidatus Harrisonbacteria bacterium CG10_big_fil_rev_8_21_14_0_10_38_8 TaxID=1974582 RepID=A0A2M6WJX6_9BACT|nr:MAG: elongation factor 4 [Candidatus Harrisonbacteria bacterium CG10_big_fil_rev_8_21_14_0_10_38_8]